jgi:gliding motility-associated-like protein
MGEGQGVALPPGQPEQEACTALRLCGGSFSTPYSYQGYGKVKEALQGDPMLGGGCHSENNSVWFRIDVVTPGAIVFKITPRNPADDYDFTVWDGTLANCGYLQSYTYQRLRCNGNVPDGSDGTIGLDYTSTLTTVPGSTQGSQYLQYIDAPAGHFYYILVDNYTGSVNGFSIDFAGSTAGFKSVGPPAYGTMLSTCEDKSMTVHLDKPVLCSSIAPDGSDFQLLTTAGAVVSARGINCSGSEGYTQDIFIELSNALPSNIYVIRARKGTDGNSLVGLCGEEQLTTNQFSAYFWEAINIKMVQDTAICIGGKLTLPAAITGGAIPPAHNAIKWTPAAYLDNAAVANPIATPVKDTAFIITVADGVLPACITKDTIRVKVIQGFDLLNNDTAICKGDQVMLKATGDSRYQYVWSPNTYLSGTAPLDRTATPATDIAYTLKASYPGCTDSLQSIEITVEPVPQVSIGPNENYCYGDQLQMTPTVIPSNYSRYQYNWKPVTVFDKAATARPLFRSLSDASVALTVTTLHGCTGTAGKNIKVYTYPHVEAGPDVITAAGKPVTLRGTIDNPLATILWTPAAYLSNPGILTPVATPLAAQLYYLTATNATCIAYDSVLVKVYNEINVPNAFSPNGDGIHDKWTVDYLEDYPLATIDVFNRWGQLVYHTDASHANGWDGTLNGKPLPAGAYYYIIQPRANGYGKITGALTLIR